MTKSFDRTRRLQYYKQALSDLKRGRYFSICITIVAQKDFFGYSIKRGMFPELDLFIPNRKDYSEYWFPTSADTTARQIILEFCIAMLEN